MQTLDKWWGVWDVEETRQGKVPQTQGLKSDTFYGRLVVLQRMTLRTMKGYVSKFGQDTSFEKLQQSKENPIPVLENF